MEAESALDNLSDALDTDVEAALDAVSDDSQHPSREGALDALSDIESVVSDGPQSLGSEDDDDARGGDTRNAETPLHSTTAIMPIAIRKAPCVL